MAERAERTAKELGKALRWGRKWLALSGWKTKLFVSRAPKELKKICDIGGTLYDREEKTAEIAIDRRRAREEGIDSLFVLFHELAHIFLAGCRIGEEREDRMADAIADLMFSLYKYEQKAKS